MTNAERAEWLADIIPAYGDYAKEAAVFLRKYAELERNLSGAKSPHPMDIKFCPACDKEWHE